MAPRALNRTVIAVALAAAGVAFNANAATSLTNTPANAAQATAPANTAHANATTSQSLSADDRHFATRAAEAGMGEVELGKLAEQKAENKQVKQFGARMVHDHSQANDRLKQIAATGNMTLPMRLETSAQKDLDKLTKLSGEQFDRAYISKQVSGHEKLIKEFKKEAQSGKDADLRAFASNTLPTLEEHLQLAKSAQQAIQDEAAKNASSTSGRKLAKKATGASYATAEKQEHMPVPKTGM